METIDLKQKLKEIYQNHRYVDKHDLISLQYTADDMIEFAKQMSDMAIDLCKENVIHKTIVLGECLSSSQIEAIENTKNQIK